MAFAAANEEADVLRNDAEVNVDSFKYAFEFSNSIKAQQEGKLKAEDTWSVTGDNSHTSPEGEHVAIEYVADENGFQVLSAHPPLPTPHPIPEAIQRSLEWIAAHPQPEHH